MTKGTHHVTTTYISSRIPAPCIPLHPSFQCLLLLFLLKVSVCNICTFQPFNVNTSGLPVQCSFFVAIVSINDDSIGQHFFIFYLTFQMFILGGSTHTTILFVYFRLSFFFLIDLQKLFLCMRVEALPHACVKYLLSFHNLNIVPYSCHKFNCNY